MKIAIIGSRELIVKDLANYLPSDVTEIVSMTGWHPQRIYELIKEKCTARN